MVFNDRYGMHRIYYHQAKDTVYFAAEAKAILAVRSELRRMDTRSLGEFVSCGAVLENRTVFEGIHVVPPSSAWILRTVRSSEKPVISTLKSGKGKRPSIPNPTIRSSVRLLRATFPGISRGREQIGYVAKRVAAGEAVTDVWGCGVARSILPGDRVFLHRVAQEPRGVFGSGYVTRAPYEVPDANSKRGYRLCIDFVYDWLVDAHQDVVVSRDALRVHPFSVQTWDAQSSGTSIKPVAEGALEKRWAELTGKRKPPLLDAPSGPTRSSKVSAHAANKQTTKRAR